jgi:hypothetical protein
MPDEIALEVQFVGLCMFVPVKDPRTMHVLLPAARGHAHPHGDAHPPREPDCGVQPRHRAQVFDEHVTRLAFDSAHLRPGSAKRDDVLVLVALDRHAVELGGTPPIAPDHGLPPEVAKHVAGHKVPPVVLGDDQGKKLNARVTLRAGASLATAKDDKACWMYETVPQTLTNRVRWSLASPGTELVLNLAPLFDGGPPASLRLYPLADGSLTLQFHHVPRHELPPDEADVPEPCKDEPAEHFRHYYPIFGNVTGTPPVFLSVKACDEVGFASKPFTCLASQAEPA